VSPLARLTAILTFVTVTGILYVGRDILVPLALSVLLAFLLAPAVRRFERFGLHRSVATSLVAAMALAVVTAVLWVCATQVVSLAASLPEYRQNIRAKIGGLNATTGSTLGRLVSTIREIGTEVADERKAEQAMEAARAAEADPSAAGSSPEPVKPPLQVSVAPPVPGPIDLVREVIGPLVGPLATTAAVLIFTFVMLLKREDLRDRLIRLVGYGDLNRTTQMMEEAGGRVSRYLRMQLIVNVCYGVPVGIALFLLGVPNAALWAFLAIALRFIPYLGPWVAAAFPIALAFAISDGWSLVLWTIGVFLVLELVSNNIVEPWLYGASTGLSVLAVLVAAVFWTWLWGAVGLLLATPLTVCLFVLGRHLPGLSFLTVMLGDEPVLSPLDRFYQRLLAMDGEEATELAEAFATEHGQRSLYVDLLIPTLQFAEHDRHAQLLSEERSRSILDTTRRLVEDLSDAHVGTAGSAGDPRPPVCVLTARDEADEIVAMMLVHTMQASGINAEVLSATLLKGEALERASALHPRSVCISALPPGAVLHASALCRRLRARLPDATIVVALWHAEGDLERATQRLQAAGATRVVTSIDAAVNALASAGEIEVPVALQ
jgi:predicted PurR-regulated permease PerM